MLLQQSRDVSCLSSCGKQIVSTYIHCFLETEAVFDLGRPNHCDTVSPQKIWGRDIICINIIYLKSFHPPDECLVFTFSVSTTRQRDCFQIFQQLNTAQQLVPDCLSAVWCRGDRVYQRFFTKNGRDAVENTVDGGDSEPNNKVARHKTKTVEMHQNRAEDNFRADIVI